MKWQLICENGHSKAVEEADELADAVSYFYCEVCETSEFTLEPDSLEIYCTRCGWRDDCDLEDARGWFASACPDCELNDFGDGHLMVVGSRDYELTMYEAFHDKESPVRFEVDGRPDYWEMVTHFCSQEAFVQITEERRIRMAPTGLLGVPAVCLTDAPYEVSSHFKRRYGPCGFVFRKHDLLKIGGGPALYMNDIIIEAQQKVGFAGEILPFQ